MRLNGRCRKKLHLLIKGLELAKECQRALIQQGQLLIINKRITPLKGFYLIVLNHSESLSMWFQYPKVLSKLGFFLMDALKASIAWNGDGNEADVHL